MIVVLEKTVNKDKKVRISLIRAGKTLSGSKDMFLGWQDEDLLEQEDRRLEDKAETGIYPKVDRVYTSPLSRARETAYIIYRGKPVITTKGLEPFDYGDFSGKEIKALVKDPKMLEVIYSPVVEKPPGGESPYVFAARVTAAFKEILCSIEQKDIDSIAIVTHRTVILTLIRRYVVPRSIHHDIKLSYGEGVEIKYDYNSQIAEILNFY